MVEALGIIIDRCPKGRPCKIENSSIVKIGCSYSSNSKISMKNFRG